MKHKIISILICITLFATVLAVAQPETNNNNIETMQANLVDNNPNLTFAMWDKQLFFNVTAASGGGGNFGTEFDGTNFYSSRWANGLIHKYSMSGVKIEQFSIPGVTSLMDLAFDGTYMYGGTWNGTIYKMNFTSKTLVGIINGSFISRAIV